MVLIFIGLSYALTLIFGGMFISRGQFTVGELVTFITYLDMLVWPLQAMGYLFNISQRGAVSYERIERLLAEKSDVKETKNQFPLSKTVVWSITLNVFLIRKQQLCPIFTFR